MLRADVRVLLDVGLRHLRFSARRAANALDLDKSLVQRWRSGKQSIAPGGWADVLHVLLEAQREAKGRELRGIIDKAEKSAVLGGTALRDKRRKRGWTQAYVARVVGVRAPTVSLWERSKSPISADYTDSLRRLFAASTVLEPELTTNAVTLRRERLRAGMSRSATI